MSSNSFYTPAMQKAMDAHRHQSLQLNTPATRGLMPGQAIEANYNKNAWNPHDSYMRGMAAYYNDVANQAQRRPSPPRTPRKQSPSRKQESPQKQSPSRKQSPPRTPRSPSKKGGRRVSNRRIRRTRRHH